MIYEKYIKESTPATKKTKVLNEDLIKSIISTREDLINANKNFEFAEGELIDYYLYQIKATQSKYNYLLRKAKKSGLLVSMLDEIEIKNLNEAI
ncbi:MAG: YaaL family protein [Clostridia bacterium]|nr:YaaL family protein [Clostridia bacterium]